MSGGDPAPVTVIVAVPAALRAQFFDPQSWTRLQAAAALWGGTIEVLDDPRAIASGSVRWPHARALVTTWGTPPVGAAELERLPRLLVIAHTGASVRPLVTDALVASGVAITQAGQAMARPVAEVALTFTLAALHQFARFDHALHDGTPWEQAEAAPARYEILGTRIGVVGASRTGRTYIELVRALGASVTVYDPYLDDAEARELGVQKASLADVMAGSRVVALHAPSLPVTHHMIGAAELAAMPDGAALVNTARSWLVDEAALLAELSTGRIDAGIDVFDDEPLPADHPFRALPNVLMTPHHAAATVQGRLRQGGIVADEIERCANAKPLRHCVTAHDLERMA